MGFGPTVPVVRGRAPQRSTKSIFDPVHGPITLGPLALELVSTPEFQRLWGIRQTGFAHLVFPGANHTRLEHSLGTFWVASRMAERLGLSPEEVDRVGAAGLLHDLGHGPFSHTLDSPLEEVLRSGHETVSRRRIEGTDPLWPAARVKVPGVLERHGIEPDAVARLVDPTRSRYPRLPAAILHGAIDADRIDYLQRDAHYTGVAHGAIDAVRLLETLRAAEGRLAFAEKGRSAVEGFLLGRSLMYSAVYYHKTVRAAEMMAQAAVERTPGYPHAARELFALRDAELLDRLVAARGPSQSLVEALLDRRLYKRAFGWPRLAPGTRARWSRLLREPSRRRSFEDLLAGRIRAPAGSVLVDLAGIEARTDPSDDWRTVVLVDGARRGRPFERPGPWGAFSSRPPAEWAVSVYVAPRYRTRAEGLRSAANRLLP
jgi:uncharacterized protein